MEHVVVDDLAAATGFLLALGVEPQGEGSGSHAPATTRGIGHIAFIGGIIVEPAERIG
jgi:hypothetical protein